MTESQRWSIKILGGSGFSYWFIAMRVFPEDMKAGRGFWKAKVPSKLSYQIWKVLHEEGIKLSDYRNGESMIAKSVVREIDSPALRKVQ